jgi:hypothetical protein
MEFDKRMYRPLFPLLAALACLGLAACHSDPNEEAVQCPKPYLLPEASHFTHYDGRGTDLSNLVLNVRLTDVEGACLGKLGEKQENAHAHAVMVVSRGPAAQSAEADIPYKIGVMRAGQIIDEKGFVAHVTFPPNVTTLQVTGQEIPMLLPTGKNVTGPDYHLYFWLDLTPAELEANRRNPAG